MKSRILRSAGIALAMLIPAGGLVALGAGTAGATTQASPKVTPHFTFHTGFGTSHVACTKKTITFLATSPFTMWQNKTFNTPCASTGSTQGGIGTATAITFLIAPTGWLVTLSPFSSKLKKTKTSVKLTIGSSHCDITFTSTITLSLTSSTHKVLKVPSTSTSATTVTGGGLTCAAIQALLHASGSTFQGTLTSNTTYTAL
jgi:hypothetical protein